MASEKHEVPGHVVGVYLAVGGLIVWLLLSSRVEKMKYEAATGTCTTCGQTAVTEIEDATHEMYHSLGQHSTFVGTGGQAFSNVPYQESAGSGPAHLGGWPN